MPTVTPMAAVIERLDKMDKFKRAVRDPSSVFKTPDDLAIDKDLSYEQKVALLKNWAWDTQELLVAEDESMKSDNSNAGELLEDIQSALSDLQSKTKPHK